MKVLQLCLKPPYPPVDGGTLAMNSITQGLLDAGCEVRVLSVCSEKHPVRTGQMTEEYLRATRFEAVEVDLRVRPLAALTALLCGESYNVKRFESRDFEHRLAEILDHETFDIVHVESIFLAPYVETIRRHSQARIVLRAHNVEHQIWQRTAAREKNPLKRWYLKKLALALRVYELEHLPSFDGIACITKDDADLFRHTPAPSGRSCGRPIVDLPFGIISPEISENVGVEENSLFHIGSMDWMPNEESVRWFLSDVWPLLHKELPQVRLYLAGRKMPQDLMDADIEGVRIVGEVPDATYFISSKQINVVPLLSGSGIRVKIIEAMSIGKTVVTTTIGAQGIDYTDGHDLLIANTPEEFVSQIRRCVDNPEFCHQIGQNAFNLIASHYDNRTLTRRLTDFYNRLLDRAGQ